MSDPAGTGTTPEKPVFSLPENYKPGELTVTGFEEKGTVQLETGTEVPVKDFGAGAYEKIDYQIPQVQKGVSVGTFMPGTDKPISSSVTYRAPATPRKVGSEVRTGPTAAQFEAIRVQNKVLADLVPIALEFKDLSHEIKSLEEKGLSGASLAQLEEAELRVAKSIEDIYEDADEDKLNAANQYLRELREVLEKVKNEPLPTSAPIPDQQLTDLEKNLQLHKELLDLSVEVDATVKEARSLEEEISDDVTKAKFQDDITNFETLFTQLKKNPEVGLKLDFESAFEAFKYDVNIIKAFIRTNPKPAATPQPTPAPTAAPTPEPLREYGGWPTFNVYFRKQTKNTLGGWFARDNDKEPLPDQEMWESESKAFELAYRRYIDFLRPLKLADRQLLKPLIDARARVIEAVKAKDVMRVAATREEFEAALEDWQKRWKMLGEVKEGDKKFGDIKRAAEKVLANIENQTEADNLRAKQNEITDQLRKAREGALAGSNIDFDKLSGAIDGYKAIIERYEATQNALSVKTRTGKSTGVLRPIIATDKNRNVKIRTIDGREPTVGEYAAELESKKREGDSVVVSKEDLNEWPELRSEPGFHFGVGETVNRREFEYLKAITKYVRMIRRDENAFLSLYVTPTEDPVTHDVKYTETENLRKHPQRDIIRKAFLKAKNILITNLTREEIHGHEQKKKEGEYLGMSKYGMVYNPSKDKASKVEVQTVDKDGNPITITKKSSISSYGGMETKEEWSKRITKEAKKEKNPMAEDLGNEPKPEPVQEPELSHEQEERRRETLKKIDQIIKAHENWYASKSKDGIVDWRKMLKIGALATAVIVGPAIVLNAVDKNHSVWRAFNMPTAVVNTGSAKPAEAQPTKKETLEGWRNYHNLENKPLTEDISKLTFEQFVKKNAKGIINTENPAAVGEMASMEGYKILHDPNPCYGLGDDQRSKLCNFIRRLENVSQATDAPERKVAEEKVGTYSAPSNEYMTPTVTLEQYFNLLKKKIAQADARDGYNA